MVVDVSKSMFGTEMRTMTASLVTTQAAAAVVVASGALTKKIPVVVRSRTYKRRMVAHSLLRHHRDARASRPNSEAYWAANHRLLTEQLINLRRLLPLLL